MDSIFKAFNNKLEQARFWPLNIDTKYKSANYAYIQMEYLSLNYRGGNAPGGLATLSHFSGRSI